MRDQIVVNAAGVAYRRREFVDALGRLRIGDKRLDSFPKPGAETCAGCGASLASVRSSKRFCGDACKMMAYRQRKKAG